MGRSRQRVACLAVGATVALAGCGADDDAGTQERELSVWFNDPGTELQGEINEVMSSFEEANPGVSVNLRFVGGADTHQQYVTAVAGGEPPCVAQLGNTWTPEFAQMGALAEVDLSEDEARDQFVGSMVDSATLDGAVYGYPYNVANRAFVYRTDLLDASGLEVPETWEDVKAAAITLSEDNADEGIAGFGVIGGEIWYYLPLVWNWGGEIAVQDGDSWEATMDSPEAKEAFEFYGSLLRDDNVAPAESASWVGADAVQSLSLGKIAMGVFASFQVKSVIAQAPELEEHLAVAELPMGPGGNNDTFAGGSNLVIFEDCEYKEEATELLHHMVEPENVVGYTSSIGMLPASLEGMEAEQATGSFSTELLSPFVDQARHTRYVPADPAWGEIEGSGAIINAMQAIMGGQLDADTAMDDLNAEMNSIFDE